MNCKNLWNMFDKVGGMLFVLTNLAGFVYYETGSHIEYETNRHNEDFEKVEELADSNGDSLTTREEWAKNVYEKLGIEFSDFSNPREDLSTLQLEKFLFEKLYLSYHK